MRLDSISALTRSRFGRASMGLAQITYLLFLLAMNYTIDYYSDDVQQAVMALPKSLQVRYVSLTGRMMEHGPNLGEPHTKPFGTGLFELRLKGAEGIARCFTAPWSIDGLSCCIALSRKPTKCRQPIGGLQKHG